MTCWEYLSAAPSITIGDLNEWGAMGWEAVGYDHNGRLLMKRALPPVGWDPDKPWPSDARKDAAPAQS